MPVRVYRFVRVSLHVFGALGMAIFILPRADLARRRRLVRRWSERLLTLLHVAPRVDGIPATGLPGNLLIVANHISWLDIFVVNAFLPARFVGKSELRRWPVVSHLIVGAGTVFVERERRRDTHRVTRQMAEVLASGDIIAIFPEGTTTDGRDLQRFHSSLFQPIVDAGGHVQPVAIRYCDRDGTHNDAPAYVGETSFMQSFWRLCGERSCVVHMHLAPSLPAVSRHRRELARDAEQAIRQVLATLAQGPRPGTPDDRPA